MGRQEESFPFGIRHASLLESVTPPPCFQANSNAKRQKVSHPNYAAYQKQGIRRSTRHRKVRGEKALLVSANQTLKDLKIQVSDLCRRLPNGG